MTRGAVLGTPQGDIMATRNAQQALVAGRVVLLAQPATGLTELAVVLGNALQAGGHAASPGAARRYYMLALRRRSPLVSRPPLLAKDLNACTVPQCLQP
jgi:hypothetical protein